MGQKGPVRAETEENKRDQLNLANPSTKTRKVIQMMDNRGAGRPMRPQYGHGEEQRRDGTDSAGTLTLNERTEELQQQRGHSMGADPGEQKSSQSLELGEGRVLRPQCQDNKKRPY